MVKTIDEYLDELKKALAGNDPALIQDALSDAEEHLRTAVAEHNGPGSPDEALASILAKFGSPEEVAAGYKGIENRPLLLPARPVSKPRRSALARFFGVFGEPRAWAAVIYMLFALVTGIVYFTWVVTGLSVSAGLIVLIVGLPVLVLFLLSVRAIAYVEGRLVEALLGERMPRRARFFDQNAGWWRKIKYLFASRSTWTAMAYCVLQLPLGVAYFTIAVTLITVSAYAIAAPLIQLFSGTPSYGFIIGDTMYQSADWAMPIFVAGGILLLTLTMHFARLVGKFHGRLAKALLVSGPS